MGSSTKCSQPMMMPMDMSQCQFLQQQPMLGTDCMTWTESMPKTASMMRMVEQYQQLQLQISSPIRIASFQSYSRFFLSPCTCDSIFFYRRCDSSLQIFFRKRLPSTKGIGIDTTQPITAAQMIIALPSRHHSLEQMAETTMACQIIEASIKAPRDMLEKNSSWDRQQSEQRLQLVHLLFWKLRSKTSGVFSALSSTQNHRIITEKRKNHRGTDSRMWVWNWPAEAWPQQSTSAVLQFRLREPSAEELLKESVGTELTCRKTLLTKRVLREVESVTEQNWLQLRLVKKLKAESGIPEVRAVLGLLPKDFKLLKDESVVVARLMVWQAQLAVLADTSKGTARYNLKLPELSANVNRKAQFSPPTTF